MEADILERQFPRLPREVSPMCWLSLPDGASVTHIRPAVEHIAEKRHWAGLLMEAILRMGKLLGATGRLEGSARSGFQVEAERTDLDNEMAATAAQLEQAEAEAVRLAVSRHAGRAVDAGEVGFGVEYNRKFTLTGVGELLSQARQFVSLGVQKAVPPLGRLFLQRVLDGVCRRDHPDYAAIGRAIEQADLNDTPTERIDA